MLFLLYIRGLKSLLVFYFRVEENFALGQFREIPFAVDIIFAGGKFRAKSKFAKIAKINSTRKNGVIQNKSARLITRTRQHDHITPVLRALHWLPVCHRLQFKVLSNACMDRPRIT